MANPFMTECLNMCSLSLELTLRNGKKYWVFTHWPYGRPASTSGMLAQIPALASPCPQQRLNSRAPWVWVGLSKGRAQQPVSAEEQEPCYVPCPSSPPGVREWPQSCVGNELGASASISAQSQSRSLPQISGLLSLRRAMSTNH